jgi:glyoxylase-like metal-dependent hydrolase (beta-lactamase superfamily II)
MPEHREIGPGIHRAVDAFTNWYIVEDGGALTVVDAGVPTSWSTLQSLLANIGRSLRDVRALVLTHAHFDHIGIAERLRQSAGIEVWLHENDVPLSRHPTQYGHERSPLRYLSNPAFRPVFAAFVRTRAFWPRSISRVRRFADGDLLPVPGQPLVVAAPGHTLGQTMLWMPDRRAVITGDAVVTLDPYTGRTGPRIVAGGATADSERALASLDRLAGLDADVLLPGHGDPWYGSPAQAARLAQDAGPA